LLNNLQGKLKFKANLNNKQFTTDSEGAVLRDWSLLPHPREKFRVFENQW
jgi:hypothetical protein